MARQLESRAYLLDDAERQAYLPAARLVARVAHREIDLVQPLSDFDYLLVLCAHLIVTGEGDVDAMLTEIISECLEERRRRPS